MNVHDSIAVKSIAEICGQENPSGLPAALMDYEPAKRWAQSTVSWWVCLSGMDKSYPRDREIPAEEWSQIRDDMIKTTGHTPWIQCDPNGRLRLFFAGVWIFPALKTWTIEELREMGVQIPLEPKRIGSDMPVDKVEWMVGYADLDTGQLITTQEGAQSVFSRSSGEKLAKRLGDPWKIFHMDSGLPPADHEKWLELNKGALPSGQGWNSGWSK